MRADEKLTAFLELESAIRTSQSFPVREVLQSDDMKSRSFSGRVLDV